MANVCRRTLVVGARKSVSSAYAMLRCLHWLCVPQRISFKLAVMVYQCVGGLGPTYLADPLQPVARTPGRHRLRSSSTSALDVPSTRPSTVGDRAFPVAAARTWNSLTGRSDLIKFYANLQNQTKVSFFLGVVSIVSK